MQGNNNHNEVSYVLKGIVLFNNTNIQFKVVKIKCLLACLIIACLNNCRKIMSQTNLYIMTYA